MFSLFLMFCQIMSYLAQLFCILACYLSELYCLIVCYLAEIFCQIVSYSAEQQHKITFLELNLRLVFVIVLRKMLVWKKLLSLLILPIYCCLFASNGNCKPKTKTSNSFSGKHLISWISEHKTVSDILLNFSYFC